MLVGHTPPDLRGTVRVTIMLVSLSLVGCAFISWSLVALSTAAVAIEVLRLNLIKQAMERDEAGPIAIVGAIVSTLRMDVSIYNKPTLIQARACSFSCSAL